MCLKAGTDLTLILDWNGKLRISAAAITIQLRVTKVEFVYKSNKNSNGADTSGLRDRTHDWQVQGKWGVGGMNGEKKLSFPFRVFYCPLPSPSHSPLKRQPKDLRLNKDPKGRPGSNESQMNKPDITSACLYSTLQFPYQFQHVI